jgi:hypothetical protein
MTQGDQVVSISNQYRRVRSRVSDMCAGQIPDSGGLFHPMQGNVQQQRTDHAPNAVGNFDFNVTLSYRRLERPRRVTNEA